MSHLRELADRALGRASCITPRVASRFEPERLGPEMARAEQTERVMTNVDDDIQGSGRIAQATAPRRAAIPGGRRAAAGEPRAPLALEAPRGDEPLPSAERAAPRGDEPLPSVERAAPRADELLPSVERAAPRADEPLPSVEQATLMTKPATPVSERARAARSQSPAQRAVATKSDIAPESMFESAQSDPGSSTSHLAAGSNRLPESDLARRPSKPAPESRLASPETDDLVAEPASSHARPARRPRDTAVDSSAPAPRVARAQLAPRAEAPEAPPSIRVEIGRIEVRAPAEPKRAPRPSRPAPALSLDAYLARRKGGAS